MAIMANKRSMMTFYSGSKDIYSHQVRIVLAEKGVGVDIIDVQPGAEPEDLRDLNPYNETPTMVDRDLVLYQARIIMEYLDERFPHPPLMPVYPVARSRSRLMMYRIEKEWYSLVHQIYANADAESVQEARKQLLDSLTALEPVFSEHPYFFSDEFSLVDCIIIPVLWRLPELGIELPEQAPKIKAYAERLFTRDSFQASLTEAERDIRAS